MKAALPAARAGLPRKSGLQFAGIDPGYGNEPDDDDTSDPTSFKKH